MVNIPEVLPGYSVNVIVHPEDCRPEDHYEDQRDIDSVYERMEVNPWAWCTVEVRVSRLVVNTYELDQLSEFLGCCSYESEEDFVKNSLYFVEMMFTAFERLINGG